MLLKVRWRRRRRFHKGVELSIADLLPKTFLSFPEGRSSEIAKYAADVRTDCEKIARVQSTMYRPEVSRSAQTKKSTQLCVHTLAITHDNHWYRVIKALIESTRSSAVALTNNESRKPHSRKRSREVARFACNCRPQIAVACYSHADLASSEAIMNEVNRGRIKTETEGRTTRKREKKFLRPLLKRNKVRAGLGSPSSFVAPGTSCGARVRIVLPRPSAAMSIRKRSLSSSMHTPSLPSTYAFLLYPISSFGWPALDIKQPHG